jgi:hypothetical protein
MVHSKYQSFANEKNQEPFKFTNLFWNAGGLNEIKILEFQNLLDLHKPDIFGIIDAGSFAENDDNMINYFKSYQIKVKKETEKSLVVLV